MLATLSLDLLEWDLVRDTVLGLEWDLEQRNENGSIRDESWNRNGVRAQNMNPYQTAILGEDGELKSTAHEACCVEGSASPQV